MDGAHCKESEGAAAAVRGSAKSTSTAARRTSGSRTRGVDVIGILLWVSCWHNAGRTFRVVRSSTYSGRDRWRTTAGKVHGRSAPARYPDRCTIQTLISGEGQYARETSKGGCGA